MHYKKEDLEYVRLMARSDSICNVQNDCVQGGKYSSSAALPLILSYSLGARRANSGCIALEVISQLSE